MGGTIAYLKKMEGWIVVRCMVGPMQTNGACTSIMDFSLKSGITDTDLCYF